MTEREKFNETSLPEKEDFYSSLSMEKITVLDYMHAKRICKVFEVKDLDQYYDLFLKSDTLHLPNAS